MTSALDEDGVRLEIDGKEITAFKSYDVKCDILTQPAAFSVKLGWGPVVNELLKQFQPGRTFKLFVAGVLVQTGKTDAIEVQQSGGATDISIRGRDDLAAIIDSEVTKEDVFKNITYAQLVKTALARSNVTDPVVVGSDLANRRAISGGDEEETGAQVDRTGDVVTAVNPMSKAITARTGTTWYQFVKTILDRAGLFLWCGANGSFILSEPNGKQTPIYAILRRRGDSRNVANVTSVSFKNDTTHRHAVYTLYGRANGQRKGRRQFQANYLDDEIAGLGFTKSRGLRDDHSKTQEQATAMVRRKAALARREGWNLTYTVKGHTTTGFSGKKVVWTPNTVVNVQDNELGLDGPYWIESVAYKRDASGTSTTLRLMRPEDLVFGSDE